MYSPAIGISSKTPVKTTAWPLAVSIGCICLIISLVAATVTLALIPVYLANRSVPLSSSTSRSKDITMQLGINGNSGRRRRATGDLSNVIGGTLTDAGNNQIEQQLLQGLPKGIAKDVVILNATIGYRSSTRRRRWTLTKRATNSQKQFILVIQFYIIYQTSCTVKCQIASEKTLRSALNKAIQYAVFNGLQVVMNDETLDFTIDITVDNVLFISDILPNSDTTDTEQPIPNVTFKTATTTTTTQSVVRTTTSVPSATDSLG